MTFKKSNFYIVISIIVFFTLFWFSLGKNPIKVEVVSKQGCEIRYKVLNKSNKNYRVTLDFIAYSRPVGKSQSLNGSLRSERKQEMIINGQEVKEDVLQMASVMLD